MKTEKHTKRYCFVLPYSNIAEQFLFSFSVDFKTTDTESCFDILNFEYYKLDNIYFGLIDMKAKDIIKIDEILNKFVHLGELDLSNIIVIDRIFKKDLDYSNYGPIKDNLYKRLVMTLELEDDIELLNTYKEIHKPHKMWPQIIENMNTMGVKDMELYLYKNHAFLLMDTPPYYNPKRDGEKWGNLPKEQEWQNYVAKFQKVAPKSKALEKWKIMTQIG
ncbi:L-rhamnose mutarotase [Tamlana sp. 2201CG12-4]|uniref:L-rhamnose mutarotase n=1 Tax=Tamlana sp. 2201CG12-4 TaxID=3112582 RepID=UPI002DB81A7D|nr:L-rhamnose mutarotase [Tamlana sp. 2201CG12-4]MEC3908464.1 L-rhamnose mutarotase [Tamlana sp. 2201CG12-4]